LTTPTRTPPGAEQTETEDEAAGVAGTSEAASEQSADVGAVAGAIAEPPAPSSPVPTPASAPAKPRPLQSLVDLLHDLAIAVVVCVLLITYVVQAFKVQGTSMSPELLDGERILVNKFLYRFADIDRGDVVVFWYPEDPNLSFIKRVVGLPGETVEVRNGDVWIDGRLIDEPYVRADNADRRSFPAQEIRPGHYFVLGDNRRGSNDSRSWGLVPERYIYGQAFVKIWPLGDVGAVD
jgi:signal peptidase I